MGWPAWYVHVPKAFVTTLHIQCICWVHQPARGYSVCWNKDSFVEKLTSQNFERRHFEWSQPICLSKVEKWTIEVYFFCHDFVNFIYVAFWYHRFNAALIFHCLEHFWNVLLNDLERHCCHILLRMFFMVSLDWSLKQSGARTNIFHLLRWQSCPHHRVVPSPAPPIYNRVQ